MVITDDLNDDDVDDDAAAVAHLHCWYYTA